MENYFIISQYEVTVAFQYVQILLSGLQGVFIFILYCGLNSKVSIYTVIVKFSFSAMSFFYRTRYQEIIGSYVLSFSVG